jgi:acetylornithine deacetylase/succinyl-diaminopimelate desuccinylase-like protein
LRIAFSPVSGALLDELLDWLRIPSISTGEGEPEDLERAAEWAAAKVREAGGSVELVRLDGRAPLVIGELRAADAGAPTVMIYGHYDVQGAGDLALWHSPPFEPQVRDGRVFARGAADDKGNFWPLLHAACALARDGELPVHVRVFVEGEEEAGSAAAIEWLRADRRGADAAIVYDSGMIDAQTPAITTALRGIVMCELSVRCGERDLHSGLFGGTARNALHVVHWLLAQLVPAPGGRLRDELLEAVEPPAEAERASWDRLPPGDRMLADVGAVPLDDRAAAEFHERTGARPSLDVHFIEGGAPRTVIPATARAALSLRLAPRQDPDRMRAVIERLLRDALPPGCELELSWHTAAPSLFEPDEPAIALAAQALARASGTGPVLARIGGSIPIVAELAAKGVPTVVTGFVLPDDPFHAPNESFSLRSLELGERSARELLRTFASLPSG